MDRRNRAVLLLAVAIVSVPAVQAAESSSPEVLSGIDDAIRPWIRVVVRGIETAGIAAILFGSVLATVAYVRAMWSGADENPYRSYRSNLGRAILLGLEFLVAADIIGTVAIEPSFDSLLILAGIVLIRTFLSFALEIEIERRLPWQSDPRSAPSRGSKS